MFKFNKEKLYLGQFINIFLQKVLTSKTTLPSSEKISLTEDELNRFKEELLYLRIQLLMNNLIKIGKFGKTKFTSEDIGKTTGHSLVEAMKQIGLSQDDIEMSTHLILERLDTYSNYIQQINNEELQKKGIDFFTLLYFSKVVLTNNFKKKALDQTKNFLIFDFANQIFRNDEKALKQVLKSVHFLD